MTISPETKEKMRLMWKDGLSGSEIARRLGVTRNVVTGTADRNREEFLARGSPLRPRGSGKPAGGGKRIIPSLEQLMKEQKL